MRWVAVAAREMGPWTPTVSVQGLTVLSGARRLEPVMVAIGGHLSVCQPLAIVCCTRYAWKYYLGVSPPC